MKSVNNKMKSDDQITLSAFKFICGDSNHVCRLCFTSTEQQEISFQDCVNLEKLYCNKTVTISDMLADLRVTSEPLLPLVLCSKCASTTISCYLFQKLCQYSNARWNEALNLLSSSVSQSENLNANLKSAYLIINKDNNVMFTSRKMSVSKTKSFVLNKIKKIIKNRQKYEHGKNKLIDSVCAECGERFNTIALLSKHTRIHKSKCFCPHCPKIFSTQSQVEKHAERVHYPKRLQCEQCSKMFSTKNMLEIHIRNYHQVIHCKLCMLQFPSRNDLRAHLNKHETNTCIQCKKRFINKHTFKVHIKDCGKRDKTPKFFCDICNKGYIHKNGVRTHLRIYHGFGNALSCNWCHKKFDAVSRLRNHIVKHTRERNFHCEQCGGKFVTQAALVYHTRLHTGEKPFPCDICNESFLSASRRMEHKRRKHFGPTQECNICHMKFVTGNQLRKHRQRHSNPQSKLYKATFNSSNFVQNCNITGS